MYDRGHRSAVAIACAGAFLAFLDATIVNIAFPDISSSFSGAGRDELSWVLDGYFVVIAALLVPAGGLADRFGHKRIFLLGIGGGSGGSGRTDPRRRPGRALRLAPRLPRQPAARCRRALRRLPPAAGAATRRQ